LKERQKVLTKFTKKKRKKEKLPNDKFHQNAFSGLRVVTYGRADGHSYGVANRHILIFPTTSASQINLKSGVWETACVSASKRLNEGAN
jgi:hypothetical protein